ncbi:MAG TPA: transcription termination/antitermination protein NusG [bacterium]|nr:transcription termination/antitermination protein NusG [bacterium]HOL92749.1 transcription termination/antitermination protein NusG [bacterium]HPO99036.1 transcription termination/antitermination protein NusG [bacterium]
MSQAIMAKNWYVVHTYSGFENKVKENIEATVRTEGLSDRISQIIIPTEEVVEIRDGKKTYSSQKIFPGYIIIEMEQDEETWALIKNTPGVTGFVGTGRHPLPLSPEEVENIMAHMSATEDRPRPKVVFEVGEQLKVIEGPFYNFTGYVAEINEERGRLKVMVDILGRSTPVELDFLQVEKI